MTKEMTSKSFVKNTIIYCLAAMILIALLVYLVDPFVHYHAPFFNLDHCETDERGAMIGIAKNEDYDVALIGSSMSENFTESWFNTEPFGKKAVKLCMQGAHFDDYECLLDEVLKKDTTKTVVMSLDNYVLMNVPEEYPTTIPDYLRNPKLTTESYYLWNKSVLTYYLPMYLCENIRDNFSADKAYVWAGLYKFDKYVARASYIPFRLLQTKDEESFDTYYKYLYQFVDSMMPYIKEHPDVEFIFYAPPYSVLYWDDCIRNGRLTAEISMLNEAYGNLVYQDNVRLFYFQDQEDIITNLDNYKDYSHYSSDINRLMFEYMQEGKCEVTSDTYYDRLYEFAEWARNYDYESAFH